MLRPRLLGSALALFFNLLLCLLDFFLRLNPHVHQHAHDIGAYAIKQ